MFIRSPEKWNYSFSFKKNLLPREQFAEDRLEMAIISRYFHLMTLSIMCYNLSISHLAAVLFFCKC